MGAWLKVFLPLLVLIGGLYATVVHYESRAAQLAFETQQQTQLRLAEERLADSLVAVATDLRVLSVTPALRRFVAGEADGRSLIQELFVAFVGQNGHYHQLRLLDADGQEQVRVQREAEGPRIFPPEALQSKRGRDYVVETLRLQPRQVRASRFELNVEQGVIEVPYRPVLRLSTRIVSEGRPDHVLVANLRGDVLLSGPRELTATAGTEAWLLDDEGYWILHPDPRYAWGRQLDPRMRVDTRIPALAAQLREAYGSLRIDGALYVHRRLTVRSGLAASDPLLQAPALQFVSYTPAVYEPQAFRGGRVLALVIVLLVSALGSALLVRHRIRADAAEQRANRLLREQAQASDARAWIRERTYELSLQIHATATPAEFARTVLAALAPTLDLTAACLYGAQKDRATSLAVWGVDSSEGPRSFAAGEGLVGEVLRSREERVLRPPPVGYLDVQGGLGRAAPAEIRILPLWVHGRTVGVIELALSRALAPREEEYLRAVLPLLALNLDGFLGRGAH